MDLGIPRGIESYAISSEKETDNTIVARDANGTDRTEELVQDWVDLPELNIQGLIDASVLTLGSGTVTSFPTGSGVGGGGKGSGKGAGSGSGPSVEEYGDSLYSADPFYYWKDGALLPHIIYIDGDATFKNTLYHGIYVVTGDVTLQCGHETLRGVIVQLDPDGTTTMKGNTGDRYKFEGGLVAYGEVHDSGNCSADVQYVAEYMQIFAQYANQDLSRLPIISWKYL